MKKNKNKNNNNPRLLISPLLLLMASAAAASTAACGGSGDGDGDGGDEQHLDVELSAVTSDSVLLIVSCEVGYTADIDGDAEQKEGVVREIVEDYSSSTIGRFTFQALWQDSGLLGHELTEDVTKSIDSIPEYHGKFWFDIACGEVELANP